jgi:hypothetical protein
MATTIIRKYADGTDSGWLTIEGTSNNTQTFTGTIYFRRIGAIVHIIGYGLKVKTQVESNQSVQICTVASTFLPKNSLGFSAMTNNGTGYDRVFPGLLAADGRMFVYANGDGPIVVNQNINFAITFIAP